VVYRFIACGRVQMTRWPPSALMAPKKHKQVLAQGATSAASVSYESSHISRCAGGATAMKPLSRKGTGGRIPPGSRTFIPKFLL
jgi:hypothetical protein